MLSVDRGEADILFVIGIAAISSSATSRGSQTTLLIAGVCELQENAVNCIPSGSVGLVLGGVGLMRRRY